jgi:hypothetical protein
LLIASTSNFDYRIVGKNKILNIWNLHLAVAYVRRN